MIISENYRNILAEEIRVARTKMAEEIDSRKKVYYYSAIYGIARRVYNLDFDPHIQFMDFVFNATYNIILGRINTIISGDNTIPISDDFFVRLGNCLQILEERIRNNEDGYDILEKIVSLVSMIEGNGYYLVQKGISVYTD